MKSEILKGTRHEFLGRDGGFSSGLFSTLNCSKFVGDNPEAVQKNLDYARNTVGAEKLITLNQVHGSECLLVDENSESDHEADAMVTKTPDIALGILTADCVPALFFDSKNKIIGAAHAGWKGAVAGVLESTVKSMIFQGSQSTDILVALGPCIHVDSYEVDEEFIANFDDKSCFCTINGHYHFDIVKYCIWRLKKCGVINIEVVNIDTCACNDKYFSYRHARKNSDGICGRNISLICL